MKRTGDIVVGLIAVVAIVGGILTYAQRVAAKIDQSVSQPISNGQILWATTTRNGNVFVVSYVYQDGYPYVETSYTDGLGTVNNTTMLEDQPSAFLVSGCGRFVSIVVEYNYPEGQNVSLIRSEFAGDIPCGYSEAYLPIVVR